MFHPLALEGNSMSFGVKGKLEVIHKIDINGFNQEQIKRGCKSF